MGMSLLIDSISAKKGTEILGISLIVQESSKISGISYDDLSVCDDE